MWLKNKKTFKSLGKPCVVDDFEIKNGSLINIVGNFIPTGTKVDVVCDPGYYLVEEKQVCQDGMFSKINEVIEICKR